jgi:hypothetical protein
MVLSPQLRGLLTVVPLGLLLFGCAAQDTAAPSASNLTTNLVSPGNGVADRNEVEVCKVGSTATIAAVAGSVTNSANFADGDCFVLQTSLASPTPDAVAVTETVTPANTVLDSIVVFQGLAPNQSTPLTLTKTVITGSAVANVFNGLELGALVTFYNRLVPPPPPGGGEGCTPGYWKQPHHFDSWDAAYTPSTLFSSIFENAYPGQTLLQVLSNNGNSTGLDALGRHTVAALLNAASNGVSYDFTVTEVINQFNAVYPGTKTAYIAQKDIFEAYNQQGCPLN